MADPICRWRNTTIKQIVEFTNILPHNPMLKKDAHKYIEERWFQWDGGNNFFKTPYQLAVQLGLYYEDNDYLYPRFDHAVSMEEASSYLKKWVRRYYVPNPYTGSFPPDAKAIILNEILFECTKDRSIDIDEFFKERFNVELGNKDILSNILNQYSDLKISDGVVTRKDETINVPKLGTPAHHTDKKTFFEWFGPVSHPNSTLSILKSLADKPFSSYLAAMRTKPFLLFAGISGTGKSRIVKEMAFASCPPSLQSDNVTPGNYCMIEVKPNWHDSTDLLGYVSSITKPHYVVTPFVNFLIKAKHNPKAPFFVCLDEMNLAPVEQYFAEFLSVLESRKLIDGEILSEPLIKPEYAKEYINDFKAAFIGNDSVTTKNDEVTVVAPKYYKEEIFDEIAEKGLRLPANVVVIGTVNMDETTYQFSRKVIDRAMTIEMNEVDYDSMFLNAQDTLTYPEQYTLAKYFLPKFTAAKDALEVLADEDKAFLKDNLPNRLRELDNALANTPFRIAYRVENELILYFAALREEQPEATAEALFATAIDDILMMKVLPRIEGNEEVLTAPLERLADFTSESYTRAHDKITEMQTRLSANHFTSFWP